MKKHYLNYFKLSLKAVSLALLWSVAAFNANAQVIEVDAADQPTAPGPFYVGDDAEVTFTTDVTGGNFTAGTVFYLHTGFPLSEENVLEQRTTAGTFGFTWPVSNTGSETLRISAATGSFDEETIEVAEEEVTVIGNQFSLFDMSGTGLRRITTDPINTDFDEEVILNLNLNTFGLPATTAINVQFSTDGGNTFNNMTDTDSQNEWFNGSGSNINFILTSGQKSTATIFRILQTNSNALQVNEESWAVTDDIELSIGGVSVETFFTLGTFDIEAPSTTIAAFNDDEGNPVTLYRAGQSIQVDATFTGGENQVGEFNYTAVFRNENERFTLEERISNRIDNNITVAGTIPANITLDETWDVTVEGFTSSDPTFGVEQTYSSSLAAPSDLGQLILTGGSITGGSIEFSDDADRFAVTPEIAIESIENSMVSFLLTKTSDGLTPAGTEIVLEFSTDGTNFDQIGSEISLNDDLSELVLFSDLPSDAISPNTQFRIRQLSNNGLNLSTWRLDNITISTGGTILTDGLFEANSQSITVEAPMIVLDPVNVPDGLIFPGSENELTYNITAGAFPEGTTFDVILNNGQFLFSVGTATAITPGDDQDHNVTITVPSLVGGNYELTLVSSESNVMSNTVIIPVFNTTLEITEITSASGVTDGGVDIVSPGDEITVTYTVDGEIGPGAELMLEVRDYDQDEIENDGFVLVSSEIGLDGAITGTLPGTIDFDNDGNSQPTLRIKVGSGVLAESAVEIIQDANGEDINNRDYDENVFDFSLTEGNSPLVDSAFISSGTRTAATLPFDFSLGGSVSISFIDRGGFNGIPQNVYLQASIDDGITWTTFADDEYNCASFGFNENIPQELRSTATRIRFIYNMDGEAAEFENQLAIGGITLRASRLVEGSISEVMFGDQFRKPAVTLENLTDTEFTVGEQVTIEYTTTGPFPANTAFAIVLSGDDGLNTVIGESDQQGTASVEVTMPFFANSMNGSGDELYNALEIVAFNRATPTTSYVADEMIIVNEDEQFLVIEGINEDESSNGSFVFDQVGDRSILTQAFDLSSATDETVSVNFTFNSEEIEVTSNQLTIPVLQVSIDGGANFQNIAVEENGLLGDGFIFNNMSYSADVPAEFITSATHFRWFQPLNLGGDTDTWEISNISIILDNGNEITTFYDENNSPIGAMLMDPVVEDQYLWEQVNADTDPVFNGESFTFNWDRLFETSPIFPTGTTFEFVLADATSGDFIIDPNTDRPFVVATSTGTGSFEGNVPFFLEAGSYSIGLIASIEDPENGTYFYFGNADGESDQSVGNLDVFLRAVRISPLGDPNATRYAGNDLTFSILLENDDENETNTTDLYANLIAEFGDDDWLLTSQQGTADITTALLPFIVGDVDFRVEFSEGGPLGEAGTIIEENTLDDLEDDADNFISGDVDEGDGVTFANASGRRFITTREFAIGELSETILFQFDLTFNRIPSQLTADQSLIFEVSTDGGNTYTSLQTFPEVDATEDLDGENFQFMVTDEMKNNPTTFRWRQEEGNGTVSLTDVGFTVAETLPFDYITTNVGIDSQAVLISSLTAEELCLDDNITINYEIRGRFGSGNLISVRYFAEDGSNEIIPRFEFEITEGSSSIDVLLPADYLAQGDENDRLRFQLRAFDDVTYEDRTIDVSGPISETNIEIIAPVLRTNTFEALNEESCDNDPIDVTIDDPVNYFVYQLINVETNEAIGEPLIFNDGTDGSEPSGNTIDIGVLPNTTELGLQITSNSSSGNLSCETVISSETITVEILENFQLYRNGGSGIVLVEAGDTERLCEGDASDIVELRAARLLADGSISTSGFDEVEWFVNDLDNPVEDNGDNVLGDDNGEFSISGAYFARVTDGSCSYLTESFNIEIIETPEQPEITILSGDLTGCQGEATDVVLQAPEGFEFYLWSNNETTREITVEDQGSYTVRVSNESFNTACGSPASDPVFVAREALPDLALSVNNNLTTGRIVEGDVLEGCDNVSVNVFTNGDNILSGASLRISRDGELVETSRNSTLSFTESGLYTIEWVNDDLNFDCRVTSASFNVVIFELPTESPLLTSTGDLEFCETEGEVILTAPAGFAQYRWYRNGTDVSENDEGFDATSNILVVRTTGVYGVEVGTSTNCFGPRSNSIELNVRSLPTIPPVNTGATANRMTQSEATCEEGAITFSFLGQASFSYQLINANTGLPSGEPVIGNEGITFISSESISEATEFYLEVSYADGSGCTDFDETQTVIGQPNNVILEANGATLNAVISRWSNTQLKEVRWFRNDVLLLNRTSTSITVTDGATYRVEVDFEGAGVCSASSNSIDLGTNPDNGRNGRTDGISAGISPNPATNFINVSLGGNNFGTYRVLIMTMTGQVLITEDLEKLTEEFAQTISISELERGIYNVQIIKDDEVVSFRIIKN